MEECRQAKGDMECALFNAERRKKPLSFQPKVQLLHTTVHFVDYIKSVLSCLFVILALFSID